MSDEPRCHTRAPEPLDWVPSGTLGRRVAWVKGRLWPAKLALIVALAQSCQGAGRTSSLEDQRVPRPATSAERAVARAQRQAHKQALEDQGSRESSSAEPVKAAPPPSAEPEPSAEPVASADPSVPVDAGAPDGSVDAAVAVVDAGPPDLETLCQTLCARAIACALEMVEGTSGGLDPDMVERMREQMREGEARCREECASEVDAADEERMARAGQCLQEEDCEAFLECMREVLDE